MACPTNKIDSNVTGLRIAEEECYRELAEAAADIVFLPLEPDSYPDFGAEIVTEARNPINPSRQNQKGAVVDVNANAGLTQDLTMAIAPLWQGFVFADAREKPDTTPYNGTAVDITGVANTTSDYTAASGLDAFTAGQLVLASGFGDAANNGLKTVTAATATALTVSETLVDETTPPDAAKLEAVGFQFEAAEAAIDVSGTLPRLTLSTTDATTLGLMEGEWIYLGGDTSVSRFAALEDRGWCRINSIAAGYLEFDKTDSAFTADTGTGKEIQIFFGKVIRNEEDPSLIKRRSYTFERSLGTGPAGAQGEYVHGCVANSMTLNVTTSSKVTVDMAYVGANTTYYKDASERIDATRPDPVEHHTYNSANNFSRIRVAAIDDSTSNPVPAVNYMSDLTLTIDNGVTANKAIGFLGSFDTTAANFTVSGSLEAYFTDVETVRAVRNNADITLDVAIVAQNKGFIFDVPLLGFGNGRATVEKDSPIMLPLETNAARGKFGNTLTIGVFPYLPSIAN